MTKRHYKKIVKYTFRILKKTVSTVNQDAKLHQILPTQKHRFFNRKPKRMFEINGENRSMLVIEAEQHQIQEIKDAYHKAGIIKNKSEREEYLLKDVEEPTKEKQEGFKEVYDKIND